MSERQDRAYDKSRGIKENSPRDLKQDRKMGVGGGGKKKR